MIATLPAEALAFLERELAPIGLEAAGLADLDALLALPPFTPYSPGAATTQARDHADTLALPGALLVVSLLAGGPRAERIRRCVEGLVFRDAYELAQARDLCSDAGAAGFSDPEWDLRHCEAIERWARWQATEDRVEEAMRTFVRAIGFEHAFD